MSQKGLESNLKDKLYKYLYQLLIFKRIHMLLCQHILFKKQDSIFKDHKFRIHLSIHSKSYDDQLNMKSRLHIVYYLEDLKHLQIHNLNKYYHKAQILLFLNK